MTVTKVADLLIPGETLGQVTSYIMKRSMELSALFQSGIIQEVVDEEVDMTLALNKGGYKVNMPFFNDLTGAEQILDDTTDLVINSITTGQDTAAVYARAQSYGITDLAVDMSGEDPMKQLGDAWARYWARRWQVQLINILNGAMGASNMTGNVHDISGLSGANAVISATTTIDAAGKLGDASGGLSMIAMHSQVYNKLKKDDLITFEHNSEQGRDIERYLGKEVIVDDGIPWNSSTGVATTYLFGKGAIAFREGTPKVPLEVDRASLTNGGQEWIVSRKKYVMHPRGIRWIGTPKNPTNADLATTTNWNRVYDAKEIRIVLFKHKIA